MKDGKVERWERGVNRIADLRLLAQGRHHWKHGGSDKVKSALNTKEEDALPLELEDEWEAFRFQVAVVAPSAAQIYSVSCKGGTGMDF